MTKNHTRGMSPKTAGVPKSAGQYGAQTVQQETDHPPMQQVDHPEHYMPNSEYDGYEYR